MLRTLVIEDEFHSRQALKRLLAEFCSGIDVIGEAESAADATTALRSLQPDLVFMDIELGDGTAFDVLRGLKDPSFHLIFTTAFDHYAIRAIKFNALDYLLKPIDIEELQRAVDRAKTMRRTAQHDNLRQFIHNMHRHTEESPVITLSTSDAFEYVPVRNIVRCEAQGAYTTFHMRNKAPLLVSKTLKEYEQLLDGYDFLRIHQSHLINLHEVERYIKSDGGYVILRDGTRLGVSRSKRDQFLDAMRTLK
ncbi:MAG: LytTR family DNA-binding domain-containing protein [Saprospiraceae bacterium]|nr:LytTR family DNA-binding domain-containing protein [Saprospiraceae bacterium]